MGNEVSTVSPRAAAADGDDGEFADAASCGFRVLGIQEQSPASRAGFVSFFDFILEANGIRLVRGTKDESIMRDGIKLLIAAALRALAQDTRDSTLMELIAQSEDRPMHLAVYNVKSQTTRGITRPSSI